MIITMLQESTQCGGIMNDLEAIAQRHSVRMYSDKPVDENVLAELRNVIEECNAASKLHIQMISGVENAFCGAKTHYGRFSGVHNAIALVGSDDVSPHLDEQIGYYGELLALRLVRLQCATSWAVLDNPTEYWWELKPSERLVCVLAFGYAARPGARHRSKPLESLCRIPSDLGTMPDWFRRGMEAVMLAPTSLSQQPFIFVLHENGTVSVEPSDGLFVGVGIGCAKCHFAIGAGLENFRWEEGSV